MMGVTPDEYARQTKLLEAALRRPAQEREIYLRAETDGDGQLFDRVMRLVKAAESDNGPRGLAELGAAVRRIALEALDTPRIESDLNHVGQYKIIRAIGEGAFARVFLAEQTLPVRRQVAIKVIREDVHAESVLVRFDAERQALAQMKHPNIAAIYDSGSLADGRPYFVMEYVPGPSIREFCDEQALGPAERVRRLISVCEAVQHAHQNGVIHRDLKPSNVRVTERDGRDDVKVIDFGVSRAITTPLTERAVRTVAGEIIGTYGYMSPEQVTGANVDTRSDVYALGVLLYELLAGRPAFDVAGRPFSELSRRITDGATPRVRAADHRLPVDLDIICAKAMAKEAARRYRSAGELAGDLERFLRGEAITARAPTVWYTLRVVARRHRVWTAAAAFVLITLVAALVVVAAVLRHTERQRAFAKSSVATLLTDAVERLTPQSGTADVRREVLRTLLARARAFAREFHDDREAQRLLAKVIHALGNLEVEVGRTAEAERYRDEELAILKSLAAGDPDAADLRADLSIAMVKVGDLVRARGDLAGAAAWYGDALEIDEYLAARHPSGRRHIDTLCWSYVRMGFVALHTDRAAEAAAYWARGRELAERLLAGDPRDVTALRVLYEIDGWSAVQARRVHRDEAEYRFLTREAWRRARMLVEINPTDRFDRRRVADVLQSVALSQTDPNDQQIPDQLLDEAIATLGQLVAVDPDDGDVNYSLARALCTRAGRRARLDELEAAREDADRALDVAGRLVARDAGRVDHQRMLGSSYVISSNIAARRDDRDTAYAHTEAAIEILRSLADLPSGRTGDVISYALVLLNCPVEALRDPAEARRRLEALSERLSSATGGANVPSPAVTLGLARACHQTGDTAVAIRLLERLLDALPSNHRLCDEIERDLLEYGASAGGATERR